MHHRLSAQLAEALGPDNRWFCSQRCGREVADPDELWIYFIRTGGAEDFALRYEAAMGPENRWYCSQYYKRDVRDPQTLWEYYMSGGRPGPRTVAS
ncbi:MAG TPA: hypothetical protein VFW23_02370 [Tepidisphaeraceae bacterium]|nr:hypothetical protein [Tepidisphaeraceae bacterium]